MNSFDKISEEYREKSLVQQKAAVKLFGLLKIGSSHDIIDIACGPGHSKNWLGKATSGKVTGIDISEGMIKQAKALYPEIEFRLTAMINLILPSATLHCSGSVIRIGPWQLYSIH